MVDWRYHGEEKGMASKSFDEFVRQEQEAKR